MKTIKMFMLCVVMVFGMLSVSYAGNESTPQLDLNVLNELSMQEKDAVIKAMNIAAKKKAQASAASDIISTVSEKVNGLSTDNFKKNADNIADGLISFCQKIGVAASDVLESPTGQAVIILGTLLYLVKVGFLSGSISGIIYIFTGLFFMRILYLLNTTKKVVLKNTYSGVFIVTKKEEGDIAVEKKPGKSTDTVVEEREVLAPRFSAVWGEKNTDESNVYRVIASIVALIVAIVFFANAF